VCVGGCVVCVCVGVWFVCVWCVWCECVCGVCVCVVCVWCVCECVWGVCVWCVWGVCGVFVGCGVCVVCVCVVCVCGVCVCVGARALYVFMLFGACECGNELSGFIKCGEFLD